MKLRLIQVTCFIFFWSTLYSNENDSLFNDFDWEYYVQHNNLPHLRNEKDALEHYQKIGFFDKLQYCKKRTLVILLHLENMNLVDEFIDKINNFVQLNYLHNYILKINIPVDDRLENFSHKAVHKTIDHMPEDILVTAPYHEELITQKNTKILQGLSEYLKANIEIKKENIQIIFTQNQGAAIGGFLLLLDQVIKQNIKHDFIIKLTTNVPEEERKVATSFLHIKLNKIFRKFQAVYAKQQFFDNTKENAANKRALREILNFFRLELKNFNFCPGKMFIVSQVFTEFFKKYDLVNFVNKLPKNMDYRSQQAYEQFFGYLIDYLHLNTLVTGIQNFRYSADNTVAINSSISLNYDLNYAKQLIKKNAIKLMAIYFPQFHEFEENNRLWGKGFTEWTLMNRYKGEIKRPHVDVGQYNMLDYSTRKKQGLMAQEYGIDAFCYYHYWFTNKKVMYAGLEKILKDNEPNMPFLFCWANEPWTKNWNGNEKEILIDQKYGNSDDWKKHFYYLLPFFKHSHYIKEDNCPLFFIYRIEHILKNDALEMLKLWKNLALREGFNGLKVISILGGFKPSTKLIPGYTDGFAEHMPTYLRKELIISKTEANDAQKFNEKVAKLPRLNAPHYSGIFYNFNSSSRRDNLPSLKFTKVSYKALENTLVNTIFRVASHPNKRGTNYILLNSWNEWTEQAMFEPNDIDGYRLLEITKKLFR